MAVHSFSVGFISGHLTVTELHSVSQFYWCKCDCGKERVLVSKRVLNRGFTRVSCWASCGGDCRIRPYRFNELNDREKAKLRYAEEKASRKDLLRRSLQYPP